MMANFPRGFRRSPKIIKKGHDHGPLVENRWIRAFQTMPFVISFAMTFWLSHCIALLKVLSSRTPPLVDSAAGTSNARFQCCAEKIKERNADRATSQTRFTVMLQTLLIV